MADWSPMPAAARPSPAGGVWQPNSRAWPPHARLEHREAAQHSAPPAQSYGGATAVGRSSGAQRARGGPRPAGRGCALLAATLPCWHGARMHCRLTAPAGPAPPFSSHQANQPRSPAAAARQSARKSAPSVTAKRRAAPVAAAEGAAAAAGPSAALPAPQQRQTPPLQRFAAAVCSRRHGRQHSHGAAQPASLPAWRRVRCSRASAGGTSERPAAAAKA